MPLKKKAIIAALAIICILPKAISAAAADKPELKEKSVSTTAIALKWEGLDGYGGYEVYKSEKSADEGYSMIIDCESLECIERGLKVGEPYWFKVRAYREKGGDIEYSEYSEPVKIHARPGKTSLSSAQAKVENCISLVLREIEGDVSYEIQRREAGGEFETIVSTKGLSYQDGSVKADAAYEYRARAVAKPSSGEDVHGDYSEIFSASIMPMAVPIQLSSVKKHEAVITIKDGTYTGVNGVELYRKLPKPDGGEDVVFLGEFDLESAVIVDSKLESATEYTYMSKTYALSDLGDKIPGMYSEPLVVATLVPASSDPFVNTAAQLSVDLIQLTASNDQNTVISAISLLPTLAVAMNTAENETKGQILTALTHDMDCDELSGRIAEFSASNIENSGANMRQSILIPAKSSWESALEEEGISIQSAELMPSKKASAIANDNINSSPDPSTDKDALAIVNSAAFDSAWATPYSNTDIVKGAFYSHDGSEHECLYMLSTEEAYLNDGSAVGFVKPYADGKHSFAALMPNENIRIDEYIRGLNGDKLLEALQGATQETLLVEVPKFSATTKADMNGALQSLGITDAFDPGKASFSGQSGGIYIGEIVNTATISIDECGYMAVKHGSKNGISVSKDKYIKLDKPFVYMVIDNETNIPLIIGICLLAG